MGKGMMVDAVHGVRRDLLKEDVLDRAFGVLFVAGAIDFEVGDLSLPDKVAAMQRYTAKRGREPGGSAAIGDCSDCGQPSDASLLDVCPYCGSSDEGEQLGAPLPESAKVHEGDVVVEASTLDAEVEKIRALQSGSMAGVWLIGRTLTEIEEQQLWKQRQTTDGKIAYRTIEAFCLAELGMTRRYMRDLMMICKRYTEADVRKFGPSKLRLLMQMSPEEETKALDAARGGGKVGSKRELAGQLGRKKDAPEPRRKPANGKTEPTGSTITIASIEGKKVIDLYAKPPSKKTPPEEFKPAKKIDDLPWGSLDLANDTRAFFTITRAPSGGLRLVMDVRRIGAE